MKAVAVFPHHRKVETIDVEEPGIAHPLDVKLRMLEVGVCGTDREVCSFRLGAAPPGADRVILGHESLAEVVEVGSAVRNFRPGDLAVAMVRRPCSHPDCEPCRQNMQDFCATGGYGERGIRGIDGFMTEYVVERPDFLHLVPPELREVGVLAEPLTIAEKAFAEVEKIQTRLTFTPRAPRRALILGAGPVGLLGAMRFLAAGYETYIYSRLPEQSAGGAIASAIGAAYICSEAVEAADLRARMGSIDVVYEALGGARTAIDVLGQLAPNGVFIFTGVPRHEPPPPLEMAGFLAHLVLENQAVAGIVNSGFANFRSAIASLAEFDRRWPRALRSIITHRYPLHAYRQAIFAEGDGVKRILQLDRD